MTFLSTFLGRKGPLSFAELCAAFVVAWLSVLLAVSAACSSCRRMPPPYPPGLPLHADLCDAAQANLARLECRTASGAEAWQSPGALLIDGGRSAPIPYAATCRARLRNGRNWRPDCVARAAFACDDLETLFQLTPEASCPTH